MLRAIHQTRCQVAEDMPKKDGAIEIEGRVIEPLPPYDLTRGRIVYRYK
jgi:translation initiation factor IF-1